MCEDCATNAPSEQPKMLFYMRLAVGFAALKHGVGSQHFFDRNGG
jgi:hypothetical protein